MLSLILVLLGCGGASAPPSPPAGTATPAPQTHVRVVLDWFPEPEFGGFYDAVANGTYKKAGLDVEIIPGGPGTPVLELLAAKHAEVAVGGADDLLVRRGKGLEAVAILPGFQDSPVGLMLHAEAGVARFEDLATPIASGPRTIAIEAGSSFQEFLWKKYGWENRVAMVPSTGSIGPFAADPNLVQQAFVTSEPCLAEAKGLHVTFLPGRDAGWNPYASLAIVRTADADAPWAVAFRQASLAGWEHYLQDPTAANAIISGLNPDMGAERIACVTERQGPFVRGTDGVGKMSAERWTAIAAAMTSAGQPVDATGAWKP